MARGTFSVPATIESEPARQSGQAERACCELSTSGVFASPERAGRGLISDVACVIEAATNINGDMHEAAAWFRSQPLSAFAFKTAEQLIRDGRAEDVLRYLASFETGSTG